MPVCMHCKADAPNTFRDIQSKLLLDIIDQVQVGHRCSRGAQIEPYTIADLKKHVESGECPCYSLKCFCGHLDRFSLEGLKRHLREDCEMVRLQCKYCHLKDEYPAGVLDPDMLNHFNEHSFTREQFREHQCFKEQKKIDDKMQEVDAYSKVKMHLLQNGKFINSKDGLKPCS